MCSFPIIRVSSLCPGTLFLHGQIPPADLKTPPGGKGNRQEAALQVGVGAHLWGADQEPSPPPTPHHYAISSQQSENPGQGREGPDLQKGAASQTEGSFIYFLQQRKGMG